VTNFQQALLDELRSRVAAPTVEVAPVRRSRRRLALSGAAVAVAAVALAAVGIVHRGQTPAYAVTTGADGSVSVTVHRMGNPAEANRQLRDTGNRVVVMPPSAPEDCPVSDRGTVAPDEVPAYIVMPEPDDNIARVYPGQLPPNTVVVVIPSKREPGGPPSAVAIPYLAPGPKCVVDPYAS
jgi:hypothetical protein